jgi:Bacterial low temperature requirement A protein (LtrA)
MRDESDRRGPPADPAQGSPPVQPGVGIATGRARWARLRRYLWQPPRPHGEQPRERMVGPLELFYDLAVVVLVAQAAHHLAAHLTWRGLGEFAVVFTLVWIAWTNGSLHHELHGHEDARARSTFLLQILVLVAMGAFIPEAGGARGAAFAVAGEACSRYWQCCGCWPHAGIAPSSADRAGCSSPGQRPAPSRWPAPPSCPPTLASRRGAWSTPRTWPVSQPSS